MRHPPTHRRLLLGFVTGAALIAGCVGHQAANVEESSSLLALTSAGACPVSVAGASLPQPAELEAWLNVLVQNGPRYSGSAAQNAYLDFLETQMTALNIPITRVSQSFDQWNQSGYSLTLSTPSGNVSIPVAGYIPRSASAAAGSAPSQIVYVGQGLSESDFAGAAGKIALIDAPLSENPNYDYSEHGQFTYDPFGRVQPDTGDRFGADGITLQLAVANASTAGVSGLLIATALVEEDAAGQYFPWSLPNLTFPGLLLDQENAQILKAAVAAGTTLGNIVLDGSLTADTSDMLVGILPGNNTEEYAILDTHTDGPSAVEENGGLGLLAMATVLSSLPQACRNRTLYFVFATGHMDTQYLQNSSLFVDQYPQIIQQAAFALTVEHLGATEWMDNGTDYVPSGYSQPSQFMVDRESFVNLLVAPITSNRLTGVVVFNSGPPSESNPLSPLFLGEGIPLHLAGVPTIDYIPMPDYLFQAGDAAQLTKVDTARMYTEIETMLDIYETFDALPASAFQ